MKFTRTICTAAILCGATLTALPALAGTWTGVANATIVSTYSDGRVVKVYVNPDHSYSIALPDGKTLKGDANGQSCFHQKDPAPTAGVKPACFPVKEYKVGDSFSGEDAGGKFTAAIKAGR